MQYCRYNKLRIRSEDFGGLIETAEGIFLLNQKEYATLSNFGTGKNVEATMLQRFLEIGAVVSSEEG